MHALPLCTFFSYCAVTECMPCPCTCVGRRVTFVHPVQMCLCVCVRALPSSAPPVHSLPRPGYFLTMA